MRIRVRGLVEIAQRIENDLWFLRRCRRVQISLKAEISPLRRTRQMASPDERTRCTTVPSPRSLSEATASNSGLPPTDPQRGSEMPVIRVLQKGEPAGLHASSGRLSADETKG